MGTNYLERGPETLLELLRLNYNNELETMTIALDDHLQEQKNKRKKKDEEVSSTLPRTRAKPHQVVATVGRGGGRVVSPEKKSLTTTITNTIFLWYMKPIQVL